MNGNQTSRAGSEARKQVTTGQPSARHEKDLHRYLGAAYYRALAHRDSGEGAVDAGQGATEGHEGTGGKSKVVVAYASKMGSTQEIAEVVGEELSRAGLDVEVRPAGDVRDVTPYAMVVLGSAVYAGRWRRPAVRFLARHAGALSNRPVRLFQSGPIGQAAGREPQRTAHRVLRLARRISAEPPVTFNGSLEPKRARGFLTRKMAASDMAGDFRDWDEIRAWARKLAVETRPPT